MEENNNKIKNIILHGDALNILKTLDDKIINCVVTSPPYFSLRDYKEENQLGLEPTFFEYINKLCDIFDEVKRVLKDDGTVWVNIGDSYISHNNLNSRKDKKDYNGIQNSIKRNVLRASMKDYSSKCLGLIPFRFAIEMINRGWIIRNVLIWHKNTCVPSPVKDRFTVDFEYLFFFVKKTKYYFEQQFEPLSNETINDILKRKNMDCINGTKNSKHYNNEDSVYNKQKTNRKRDEFVDLENGRNKRSVWCINPKPFVGDHSAVFPEELIETPIKAGCPENGIVLDPFIGSGTVGVVCKKLKRNYLGIEISKRSIEIAEMKIKKAKNFMYHEEKKNKKMNEWL